MLLVRQRYFKYTNQNWSISCIVHIILNNNECTPPLLKLMQLICHRYLKQYRPKHKLYKKVITFPTTYHAYSFSNKFYDESENLSYDTNFDSLSFRSTLPNCNVFLTLLSSSFFLLGLKMIFI